MRKGFLQVAHRFVWLVFIYLELGHKHITAWLVKGLWLCLWKLWRSVFNTNDNGVPQLPKTKSEFFGYRMVYFNHEIKYMYILFQMVIIFAILPHWVCYWFIYAVQSLCLSGRVAIYRCLFNHKWLGTTGLNSLKQSWRWDFTFQFGPQPDSVFKCGKQCAT